MRKKLSRLRENTRDLKDHLIRDRNYADLDWESVRTSPSVIDILYDNVSSYSVRNRTQVIELIEEDRRRLKIMEWISKKIRRDENSRLVKKKLKRLQKVVRGITKLQTHLVSKCFGIFNSGNRNLRQLQWCTQNSRAARSEMHAFYMYSFYELASQLRKRYHLFQRTKTYPPSVLNV